MAQIEATLTLTQRCTFSCTYSAPGHEGSSFVTLEGGVLWSNINVLLRCSHEQNKGHPYCFHRNSELILRMSWNQFCSVLSWWSLPAFWCGSPRQPHFLGRWNAHLWSTVFKSVKQCCRLPRSVGEADDSTWEAFRELCIQECCKPQWSEVEQDCKRTVSQNSSTGMWPSDKVTETVTVTD